jgi:hypothetical protein
MSTVKKADNRSKTNIKCIQLSSKKGRHIWTCLKNGTVVATSPVLGIASRNYDTAAAKRLVTVMEAVNEHGH